jgi:hypothetical protein
MHFGPDWKAVFEMKFEGSVRNKLIRKSFLPFTPRQSISDVQILMTPIQQIERIEDFNIRLFDKSSLPKISPLFLLIAFPFRRSTRNTTKRIMN